MKQHKIFVIIGIAWLILFLGSFCTYCLWKYNRKNGYKRDFKI